MTASVLRCGKLFDGLSDGLTGPAEILVDGDRIVEIGASVRRPPDAQTIDLSQRTVSPGFIDTHVHLTMDAAVLAQQTLASPSAKALKGLSIAREYMRYGFTTLRDMGCADPEFPTVDLRNALAVGLVEGPRLIVAAHIISASAGHGDLRGFYASRWDLPVSAIADDAGAIKALVRREHTFGSDWIKTTNTGGYFSPGDDPARVTWFDEEMNVLAATARQLGMPVAVHTGAADGCKQAIRSGARSLEHAYLIDAAALTMAKEAGVYVVPTMQMTWEDLTALHAHTLPCQAVWKFTRDNEQILSSQRLIAASDVKIAYGTDCGMFPFGHGILEFQAMVAAGLTPARALKAATSVAAELLQQDDIGVLAVGKHADMVAMPGDPLADISVTAKVDFVMKSGRVYRSPASALRLRNSPTAD
jgi:imidazolonepropionase-like amidohydrolase